MFAFLLVFSIGIISVILETFLHSMGFPIPLLALFILSVSQKISLILAIVSSLIFGISLDFLSIFPLPYSAFLLIFLVVIWKFLYVKFNNNFFVYTIISFLMPFYMNLPHIHIMFNNFFFFTIIFFIGFSCILLLPVYNKGTDFLIKKLYPNISCKN